MKDTNDTMVTRTVATEATLETSAVGQPDETLRISGAVRPKEAGYRDNDLIELTANIDNMNPEYYGDVLSRFLTAGANDAWLTPIIMKKGRPAVQLSVLCRYRMLPAMSDVLFHHTTTIGFRYHAVDRVVLERRFRTVSYKGELLHIKEAYYEGQLVNQSIEYDDLKRVSNKLDIPLKILEKKIWHLLTNDIE